MSLLRRCNDLTMTFIYFYLPIIVAVLGFNLLVIFLFWGWNHGSTFGSEWLLWIHASLKGQVTTDHKCACVHAQSWCGLNGIYVGCGCLKPCWQGGVCLWSFFTFTFIFFVVCLGFLRSIYSSGKIVAHCIFFFWNHCLMRVILPNIDFETLPKVKH